MHRRGIFCASRSQVRSVATAAKSTPIPWRESEASQKLGKRAPRSTGSASASESILAPSIQTISHWEIPETLDSNRPRREPASESNSTYAIRKWAIPRASNSSKPSAKRVSSIKELKLPDASPPLPTHSSASNPIRAFSRTPKLSLDPPSSALNKWAPQNPFTAVESSLAGRTMERDLAPHIRRQPPRMSLYSSPVDRSMERDVAPHTTQKRPGTHFHSPPVDRNLRRDPAPRRDSTRKIDWAPRFPAGSTSRPSQRVGERRSPSWSHPNIRGAPDLELHDNEQIDDKQLELQEPPLDAVIKEDEVGTTEGLGENSGRTDVNRDYRQRRVGYKERGSLVTRIDENIAISSHSRTSTHHPQFKATKLRKKKTLQEKKIAVDVYIPSTVSVGMLARLLNVRLEKLQEKMVRSGMRTEASYDHVLTSDYAVLLADEFGRNPVVNDEAAFDIYPSAPHPDPSTLPTRPPIVTIMGHVDHGKTTLLDSLRSSSVAKGEAGGITQHIGAFSVPVSTASTNSSGPSSITFLDTPGHAAFSAMRARGAGVTDIVVLVVAGDDGIMPQTREVIKLIKNDEGRVGVVVAINKVDKPGIDIENVQKALLSEGIQLEAFGGDIPSVAVSGLTGQGLDDLVETLSTLAEVQELRAERTGPVHGHVLESKVHRGLGSVASVLVTRGCMMLGSHVISGTTHAKIRLMRDSSGSSVKEAYPGMVVTVSGWKDLPSVGDEVLEGTEANVKKAVANRIRKAEAESTLVDLGAINAQRRQERELREGRGGDKQAPVETVQGPKELRIVIKGDVSGSVEAVDGALQGLGNKHAVVKVVSTGVGEVSESDVMMAKAAEGMIIAFGVSTTRSVESKAAQSGVPIHSSTIIYRVMDHIKECLVALLPPIIEQRVVGEATVLQMFDIRLKAKETMKVAGCRVINGILEKARDVRVMRDGEAIFHGSVETMRFLKKDVTEIRKGSECGLKLQKFDDLREGDLIQAYQVLEMPGTL